MTILAVVTRIGDMPDGLAGLVLLFIAGAIAALAVLRLRGDSSRKHGPVCYSGV